MNEHEAVLAPHKKPGGEKLVLIVAGEASGDLHGANLLRAMREQDGELRFAAMGGPALAGAGAEILVDAARLAVVGVVEVLSVLGDILRARRTLIDCLRTRRPALLILIDYPEFNLLLAARAKKLGIPVFYYISPQIWAWRSGRVHTIWRRVDRLAVILPFEQTFYARHGYQVDFVGHPLLDTIQPSCTPAEFRQRHAIDPQSRLVGLLPGSRGKEVRALLPDFLAAAGELAALSPEPVTFLLPLAPTISPELLDAHGLAQARKNLDIRVIREDRFSLMAACNAALAASGTVTMELALLGVPTVVAYRVSTFTYLLGRLLVRRLKHFALPNLIAERPVFPELLQHQVQPKTMAALLATFLNDQDRRLEIIRALAEVRERLGGPGASKRTAILALALLAQRNRDNHG